MQTADVAVVGAGPAGVAAAIVLARAGRDVLVLDRAGFPRDKTCGDGLTTLALRRYEQLGLDPSVVPSWRVVSAFAIRSPRGRWIDLPLPSDGTQHAAVAARGELDAAFLDVARAAGAEVRERRLVVAAHQLPDRVRLHTRDGEEIQARYLIGADGVWSPTRKQLGVDHQHGYRGEWHAMRQYHRDVDGAAASKLLVWFEPDLLPGYLWSFPLGDGRANVGFGILRGHRHRVADTGRLWQDLRSRPHVREALGPDAVPDDRMRAWPIPARVDRVPLAAGRAVWVGDAAAATDVLTGEGIGQALETGIWAAESLLEAGAHQPGLAAAAYHDRVRRGLVADHRMSRSLQRLVRRQLGVRLPLWLVDRSDWTRRSFARWLWEDYPRALAVTPRRWARDTMHAAGAYAGATV